jgi:hypothetical protein
MEQVIFIMLILVTMLFPTFPANVLAVASFPSVEY